MLINGTKLILIAGNFIRGQMYKQGGACQDCEDSEYCSTEYPGLCGKISKEQFNNMNLQFLNSFLKV